MVGKCNYHPFTISRLGRVLRKIDKSEWHSVNDDVTKYLKEDEQGKSSSSEKTSEIVDPRYDRLGYHLKLCFRYLGIFKQDIDAEDLTFLWAAEGMLASQQGDRDNGTTIDTAGDRDNGTIIDTAGDRDNGTTVDTAGDMDNGTIIDTAGDRDNGTIIDTAGDMDNGTIIDTAGDRDNGTIIDTAEHYLQELNSEGMLEVKVDGLSANRIVMPLRLHNDHWALSRYLGEKECFDLHVSNNTVVDVSDDALFKIGQMFLARKLVFHFNKQATSSLKFAMRSKHIRSLFFLNSDEEYVDLPVSMSKFEKLKLLRTVHFVRCKFKGRKLPEEIEKLACLRYLGIICCDLDTLPSSISNSRNLHVLNVRAYDDAKMKIPNIFDQTSSQLTQMKHLRLPSNLEKEQSAKLKLDALSNLETLVGFNVDVHDIDSLSNLGKLRLLVTHVADNDSLQQIIKLVMDKGSAVQIHVILEYKCNFTSSHGSYILEEMLMCPHLYALTFSMVHIHKFPNCGKFASPGLTQIKLIGCQLREDPMEALAMFPSLRKLCLGYGAFVGSKIEIHLHLDGGFEKLEYLEFRCLPNLEEWLVDSKALPNLSTLTVKRCPKLEKIPEGLTSVSSLNNFEIELPPSALSEAKENEYRKNFSSSVKNFVLRKLDRSSSARTTK